MLAGFRADALFEAWIKRHKKPSLTSLGNSGAVLLSVPSVGLLMQMQKDLSMSMPRQRAHGLSVARRSPFDLCLDWANTWVVAKLNMYIHLYMHALCDNIYIGIYVYIYIYIYISSTAQGGGGSFKDRTV